MKRILFYSACLLAGAFFAGCSEDEASGFGSLYGIATDAKTHQPIYGASVTLSPGNLSTTTGEDGHYEFTDLEAGQYKLQIQATGYQTNSRQVQINPGSRTTGDMTLSEDELSSVLQLSSSSLNFDTGYSELTLTLRNVGNAGIISWNVTGIDVAWLSISPSQGDIAMNQSSDIKVKIDRSLVSSSQSTYFVINAAGGSKAVTVMVSTQSGGGNIGGDPDPGAEDYSSATIVPCDYRIDAKIVSCKRAGTSVTFTYTLTNNGLGTVNDWRIYGPTSSSLINGGYRSVITDNEGNEYSSPGMTFRGVSSSGGIVNAAFPEDVPCKGTVTLTGVPASVKSITVMLGVFAYPDSTFQLADKRIYFKNVPIY